MTSRPRVRTRALSRPEKLLILSWAEREPAAARTLISQIEARLLGHDLHPATVVANSLSEAFAEMEKGNLVPSAILRRDP